MLYPPKLKESIWQWISCFNQPTTRMASVAPHLNTTADEMSWNIHLQSFRPCVSSKALFFLFLIFVLFFFFVIQVRLYQGSCSILKHIRSKVHTTKQQNICDISALNLHIFHIRLCKWVLPRSTLGLVPFIRLLWQFILITSHLFWPWHYWLLLSDPL